MNFPRLLVAVLALSFSGCASPERIERGFKQIWRGRAELAPGLRVHAGIGDLAHVGFGMTVGFVQGDYVYGTPDKVGILTEVDCLFHDEYRMREGSRGNWQIPDDQVGFMLLPLITSGRNRTWIHRFDIELGFTLILIDVQVGFSPGELLGFLVTLFGGDIEPEAPGDLDEHNGIPNPLLAPDPPRNDGGTP